MSAAKQNGVTEEELIEGYGAKSSLYLKLAEIVAEVGYVAKDGKNDFQNYRYTSAEALLAAIRGPLSARRIVLMPSLTALSEREYTTSKGKASVITTAHVRFTLVDGESGEKHECEWAGQGDDPADKGLGKAYTNAIKTFLREQFLIPQGDDPEADPSTDRRAQDRAPANGSAQHGQPTAAPAQQTERPATAAQRGKLNAKAAEAELCPTDYANVILIAAGEEVRDFESEEAAQQTLNRMLDRLPARLVDPALKQIERIKAVVPA
jgi:hypothetical protein